MKRMFKLFSASCVYGALLVLFLFGKVFGQLPLQLATTSDDSCMFGGCLSLYSCVKMFLFENTPVNYFTRECVNVFSMNKIKYASYLFIFLFLVLLFLGLLYLVKFIKKRYINRMNVD